ncbi:hypothetical protein C478_06945 [Natrinema thermotolerans DSM 11552]|nr:hypothetical protein C478_06945 [Natrinema thermotolerans DSM 11552]
MRGCHDRAGGDPASDDRAVSDVLAFILVFAIILGSVALLSTIGFQTMTDYQEGEQVRTADRAMAALADNFNDVLRYDGVTGREGELSLRGGTVRTGTGGTRVNVSIDGTYIGNGLNTNDGGEFDLGRFEYGLDEDTVAYEGGGVVRADDGGSVFLERPRMRCDTDHDRAVVSLVAIQNPDDRSVQADGRIGLELTSVNRETVVREGVSEVSINVTETEYETAWEGAFDSGNWSTTTSGGNIEATCGSGDDLTVVVTVLEGRIDY